MELNEGFTSEETDARALKRRRPKKWRRPIVRCDSNFRPVVIQPLDPLMDFVFTREPSNNHDTEGHGDDWIDTPNESTTVKLEVSDKQTIDNSNKYIDCSENFPPENISNMQMITNGEEINNKVDLNEPLLKLKNKESRRQSKAGDVLKTSLQGDLAERKKSVQKRRESVFVDLEDELSEFDEEFDWQIHFESFRNVIKHERLVVKVQSHTVVM